MNFNEAPATLPDGSLLGPVSFEVRGGPLMDRTR
jgi:hypothetical protein